MITLNRNPDDRILELGGGANPIVRPTCLGGKDVNVDVRDCYDADGQRTTDFVADFNEPLPIADNDFDQVVSQYCLEHVSWRKVKQFIAEMFRVLKPGGNALVVTSNTRKQFEWILANPNGWDGHDLFESASGVIFGDHDYTENSHRAYFDEQILTALFESAGFKLVRVQPYGARDTDLVIVAGKPLAFTTEVVMTKSPRTQREAAAVDERKKAVIGFHGVESEKAKEITEASAQVKDKLKEVSTQVMSREEMFDKHYFNGGGKVGGYAHEGYRDFPVHELTFRHLMMRHPKSVLEIGAARGYIGKRLEDAGVPYMGLEISKHCWMTRVCNNVYLHDVCETPWTIPDTSKFDVSFSIATLEHIPEQHLYGMLKELGKRCKRHVHAIDFGDDDDGFDKTHCTLHDKSWWATQFSNAGLTDYEIVSKHDFEKWFDGQFPADVVNGDGKLKLNVGSFTTMFHHGWVNVDVHDLMGFANGNGYRFLRHDARQAFPFNTGDVDLIFTGHFLEHLTPEEGVNFLKECRRLLKPATGAIRIVVPDAEKLTRLYATYPEKLNDYNEINDGCEVAKTPLQKLWALLHNGHQSVYDADTLSEVLKEAGFVPHVGQFRTTFVDNCEQILKETTEMGFELSLFVDAVCKTS